MVEFEPPKPKALSDAELHRAITLLGSSAEGLANSERLIAEQALLREQDSAALGAWISELQGNGSPQALAALRKLALDVLPVNLEPVQPVDSVEYKEPEAPIFTSEIPIIGRRKLSKRKEIVRKLVPGVATWLLVGLVNLLIAAWLELNVSEAIWSVTFGSLAAGLVLSFIKTHSLHPLIRSASVFGGWGVYLGAALAIAFTSLVVLEGVLHIVDSDLMISLIPGYRTDVLLCALGALLLGQLAPRAWHWLLLLISSVAVVCLVVIYGEVAPRTIEWFAYAPLSGSVFLPPEPVDWEQVGWASLAVGLMTIVIVSFSIPHSQTRAWSFTLQIPLVIGISVGLVLLGQSAITSMVTLFALFLASTAAGRDLTARPIGRWAGAAFLIPILALPVLDYLNGLAVSVLVALIVLLFGDQLFRRTPLHIPSLDTSYGFYGAFQPITWIALVVAAPFGVEAVQQLLLPESSFTVHELALIFGLVIGLAFAILRIFVIRSQDREIRNVEIRNMNLDNLLGL
ncbi:MAG: hypothetical protein RIR71_729 [Actinomycetota bacterium]